MALLIDEHIQVGAERFRAPEILFDPEIIGLEYPGVHQIVVDSINRTDLDLRKALYSNIVLSGGSTLTKGFGDRLLTEVQRLAVKDMRIKIFAPPERKYSTWIGGSILAGLSTFRKVGFHFVFGRLYVFPSLCFSLSLLCPFFAYMSLALVVRQYLLTNVRKQMWVSIDDWHENPDIIHTKFT